MAGGPTVVIAAGGTGGHIYPGLALAEAIAVAEPSARISFVGTARGLERTLIPEAGHELDLVDMVPFAGWNRVRLPAALALATIQSRAILRRRQVDVAVGMGGYASIPLVFGAKLAGIPSLIHESGAIPGRANLLAARVTRHVATAFERSNSAFPSSTVVRTVGMPLGPGLAELDREAIRPEARAAYRLDETTRFVMVNGGSQGAASLNRLALDLARRWHEQGRHDVRILLKAGAGHHDAVSLELVDHPGRDLVELTKFIVRMDHAYAAADMAICRAGAGTVAELAAVGLPALLVPYPHAPYDHQAVNAGALVEVGGALMVRDRQADASTVGPLIEERLWDKGALDAMRKGLAVVAHPHAAATLAAWTLDLATGHQRRGEGNLPRSTPSEARLVDRKGLDPPEADPALGSPHQMEPPSAALKPPTGKAGPAAVVRGASPPHPPCLAGQETCHNVPTFRPQET